jgi:hypothetical protein
MRTNSDGDSSAPRPFMPPEPQFQPNRRASGVENRVPKYVWLSCACWGVTYR